MTNAHELFHEYFEVVRAETIEMIQRSLRVRYQVYCIEKGYEDPASFPEEMESDPFDLHSVHSVVRHRNSGRIVGTVRLVLADPSDPMSLFPMEQYCGSALDKNRINPFLLPRNELGEISRFAVSKELSRGLNEKGAVSAETPMHESGSVSHTEPLIEVRRLFPQVVLALFNAIVRMSAENGITHWYAAMESSLSRLLTRFGIHFAAVGSAVDFHGHRRPFFGVVDEVLAAIYRQRPDVWTMITDHGELWPLPQQRMYSIA